MRSDGLGGRSGGGGHNLALRVGADAARGFGARGCLSAHLRRVHAKRTGRIRHVSMTEFVQIGHAVAP